MKFWILLLLCFNTQVFAQEGLLNKLLAPGPLIEGHKDLEHKDCLSCHDAGNGVPSNLCLDCHTDIKKSMDRKTTFHATRNKERLECHKDHKGRDYDSTVVDQKTFNHNETGYKLIGQHAKIECSECHKEKRTKKAVNKSGIRWFGTKVNTCNECHKSDDIHFFKSPYSTKSCGDCHGQTDWNRDVKFDHSRETGHALLGKHKDLECKSCHTSTGSGSSKYDWPNLKTQKCLACHKVQHEGKMSNKFQNGNCESCHSQTSWKISSFDHQITGFLLKGKHAQTDCIECHKQSKPSELRKNYNFQGLKQDCQSCHKDHHAYANHVSKNLGSLMKCERCHIEDGWKTHNKFNHNYDTRFDIDGKHLENNCFDCHIGSNGAKVKNPAKRIYSWSRLEQKTCETCHKSPHYNSFSVDLLRKKCTECHNTSGWDNAKEVMKKGGAFDHDKTRFPLTGKHEQAKCADCHKNAKKNGYKQPNAEKKFCINCHKNVHTKQFSEAFHEKSCAECHTTENFTDRKTFNHDRTDFNITGKHTEFRSECEKCHVKSNNVILATKPPRAGGKFIFEKIRGEYCINCHGNVHQNQFDKKFANKACTQCHTTNSFTKRKEFDHRTTQFPLKGKHAKVKCEECHIKTNKLLIKDPPKKAGKYEFPELAEKNCNTCHKDPHNGSKGKSCNKCHNENSWKSISSSDGSGGGDFHRNFGLSEVHYTLQCAECHDGEKLLAEQSQECRLCHMKDDIHRGSLPTCHECHRQSFWEQTKFKHADSLFPIRGSHRALNCNECHYNGVYQGLDNQCISCHKQDADAVVQPPHTGATYIERRDCHNEFSFGGATEDR